MQELISGSLVTIITQVLKKYPKFTLVNEGQIWRIRAVVGILSIAATIGGAYASGTLNDSATITLIANAIATYIFSTITYFGMVRS
jgi:hypothetical protein